MSYPDKRQQIDFLQRQIEAHGPLDKEVKKKIDYKFRLDWNYYSNSMEGNTLTMEETRSVMVGNLTIGGKPIKDVLEIKKHDEVISEILKLGKGEVRLSESRIIKIHEGIMHEEAESEKNKIGKWKTVPNYVLNYKQERFDFVQPEEVPARMHALLNKTNAAIDAIRQNKKNAPHPIDVALQFHLEYVLIHPFYDGNGRTARILTNLLLIAFGYPPFWISTDERTPYYQYLADIQGYGGQPDLFYEFGADKILRSQQLVLDAIAGQDISEPDDLDKELALLKAELSGESILNVAANSDTVNDMVEKNLIPLFKLIEGKCEGLKEFFFDYDRRIEFEINGQPGRKMLGSKASTWEDLIGNWLNNQMRAQKENLLLMSYTFRLIGFKKTVNAESFGFNINVTFNEYNYMLQLSSNNNIKQLPYGKILTEKELLEIATPLIKNMINRIKQLNEGV